MSKPLIDHYEAGAEKVAQAIRNLTAEDLLCVPDPAAIVGRWSIQQVVIHLADAEAAMADRIKRVIAEDDPILYAWDENLFAQRLFYEKQSAHDASEVVRLIRAQTTRILRELPAAAFSRTGNHSERGPLRLDDIVAFANTHLEHHVKFIHDKRAWMGKEMW